VASQAWGDRGAPIGGGPGDPLSGRVAIVTGAAGGLGSAMLRALCQAGATVVPVDTHGDDCLIADVVTAEGNRRMVDLALEQHGRLDILIVNAGAQAMNPDRQHTDLVGVEDYRHGLILFAQSIVPGSTQVTDSAGGDRYALLMVTTKVDGPPYGKLTIHNARLYRFYEDDKIAAEQVIFCTVPD